MDWFPVVFVTFKVLMLGTAMFFAVKWHYDRGVKAKGRRAVLRASGIGVVVFLVVLLALALLSVVLTRTLGLDLPFP